MTDMTERQIAEAWQPRIPEPEDLQCAVAGCEKLTSCTLLARIAGEPRVFALVCGFHARALADMETWEPTTNLDWTTAQLKTSPGALDGWLYVQALGKRPVLYPPESEMLEQVESYARWLNRGRPPGNPA